MMDLVTHRVVVAAIASLVLISASASVSAQSSGDDDRSLPPIAPLPETKPDAEQQEQIAPLSRDATAEARAAHLDTLFERLADPENRRWERVQQQIWATWNRSGSDSMDFLSQRADRAMEAKDYDAAKVFLNDLVRLAPEHAEGWNKRATLHFILDDYGKSLDDIARTLKLEPRHFGALSGLGIILDRIGDKTGALEAYRRAVKIHPNLRGAEEGIKKLSKEVEGRKL